MDTNLQLEHRPLRQHGRNFVDPGLALRREPQRVHDELDIGEANHPVIQKLTFVRGQSDRTPSRIHSHARRREGAGIDPVRNAVQIRVERAAARVHLRALRRVRALVRPVEDEIAVAIHRTSLSVDQDSLGGVRALVDAVEDSVAVGIQRAPLLVDHRSLRRARALVEPIEDFVLVGIEWTAAGVHDGALRSSRAAVGLVRHPVLVGVAWPPHPETRDPARDLELVHPRRAAGSVLLLVAHVSRVQSDPESLARAEHRSQAAVERAVRFGRETITVHLDGANPTVDIRERPRVTLGCEDQTGAVVGDGRAPQRRGVLVRRSSMVEALDAHPPIEKPRRAQPEGWRIAERLLGVVQIGSSFEREPHALLDRESYARRGRGENGREGDAERGSDARPDHSFPPEDRRDGVGRRQFGGFSSPCQHSGILPTMLEDRLNEDMKAALKGGDQARLSTLRMLRSQILIEKKRDVSINTLPDADAIRAFQSYAKKLKDSIAEYQKLGKAEDVERISGELKVVEEYLPATLSEAESRDMVRSVISELGATSMKDMGRVMKEVQTRAQGRGDGKLLSDLVRGSLS